MPAPPPRTPVENIAGIMLSLSRAADRPGPWGRLSRPLALLILDLIREVIQAFADLAGRISAGTCIPGLPPATPRPHANRRPRRPDKLPQTLVWRAKPLAKTAAHGRQPPTPLAEPAMAAPIAAAPAVGPPLRSLHRKRGATPLKILAPPAAVPTPPPRPPLPVPTRAKRPPWHADNVT